MVRGDEEAFSSFFGTNFPPLFRFAMARLGGDADAAEDVVQGTMCKVMRKLATYRGEASLLTWLSTFCRHEISAWYAKKQKVPPMVDLFEELPEIRAAIESLSAASEKPESVMHRSEIARLVQLILDSLPDRYGDALEWKYIDGLPVAEIAQRLGVGLKAAESVLTRARAAFRDGFTAAYGGRWTEAGI